jgi:homoserine kinase
MHPKNVAVCVFGPVFVTKVNSDLRFTVNRQWSAISTIKVVWLYPTPPMPVSTARRREALSFL